MSKRKRGNPPLYELMARRGSGRGEERHEERPLPVAPPDIPEDDEGIDWGWISPGRVVSVPVGYVFLSLAVVGLLAVGAYMLGFKRGNDAQRRLTDEQFLAHVGSLGTERPVDPLVNRPQPLRPMEDAPGGGLGDASSEVSGTSGWGRLESDLRQDGFKYFVLMETGEEGARDLARFCRQQQLETYVVVSHNNRSRRLVIAFPGFETSISTQDPGYQALRKKIEAVGRRWKQDRGDSDLRDAYPLPHPPP